MSPYQLHGPIVITVIVEVLIHGYRNLVTVDGATHPRIWCINATDVLDIHRLSVRGIDDIGFYRTAVYLLIGEAEKTECVIIFHQFAFGLSANDHGSSVRSFCHGDRLVGGSRENLLLSSQFVLGKAREGFWLCHRIGLSGH